MTSATIRPAPLAAAVPVHGLGPASGAVRRPGRSGGFRSRSVRGSARALQGPEGPLLPTAPTIVAGRRGPTVGMEAPAPAAGMRPRNRFDPFRRMQDRPVRPRGSRASLGRLGRALLLACAPLALPPAASAAPGDQCVLHTTTIGSDGRMGHLSVDAPRDLGGGFVTYRVERLQDGQSTTALVAHCATGRSLLATLSRRSPEGATHEAPFDPLALVEEAIRSPETFTLEGLAALLRSRGVEARTGLSEVEDCGCAAFYPELRGDRTPWQG